MKNPWNKGLKDWRTKAHSMNLRRAIQKRNRQHLMLGKKNPWFKTGPPFCKNRGPRHHNWRGGRKKTSGGYIYKSCWGHPRATSTGYVLEHILVAEKMLGRRLKKGEIVHHRNGKKSDNRPSNLVVLKSQAEHQSFHMRGTKWKLICPNCKHKFQMKGNCERELNL